MNKAKHILVGFSLQFFFFDAFHNSSILFTTQGMRIEALQN